MSKLILLRHGQSTWNLENRFTGWVDVELTPQGEAEAAQSGEKIKMAGIHLDKAFTSVLKRAIETLNICLRSAGQEGLPVEYDQALNERHYGDLQGLNKAETAEKFGEAQVKLWRRRPTRFSLPAAKAWKIPRSAHSPTLKAKSCPHWNGAKTFLFRRMATACAPL